MANLNTIKNWFKTGLKPTQAQFWASWESFFHKDEKIPQSAIDGLSNSLSAKQDAAGLAAVAVSGSYNDLTDIPDESNPLWRGEHTSLANLKLAHPIAESGCYANIDEGIGFDVRRALWDTSDADWVLGGVVSSAESEMQAAGLKATFDDADEFPSLDSANSFVLVKKTWANFKTALNAMYGIVASVNGKTTSAIILKEEDILGGVQDSTNIVGNVTIPIVDKAHRIMSFNGANPNITFNNLPTVGNSFVMTIETVNTGGARSLSITNTLIPYGEFNGLTGAINFITIMVSNTATAGIRFHLFFSSPN